MSFNPNTLTLPPQEDALQGVGAVPDYVPADWAEAGVTVADPVEIAPRELSLVLARSLGRVADQAAMPVADVGNGNVGVFAFNSAI